MKLYLIRHGDAVDAVEGKLKETDRYLTAEGRAQLRRVAGKLASLADDLDAVLTSPLVRAVQTAEIVSTVLGYKGPVESSRALSPGRWKRGMMAEELAGRSPAGHYALVGHNPDVEEMATTLLDLPEGAVPFKKGAVCLIETEGAPFSGKARFKWMLNPKGLRVVTSVDGL